MPVLYFNACGALLRQDQPKVSHLGMDLIESLAMSEALTQALKYSTGICVLVVRGDFAAACQSALAE